MGDERIIPVEEPLQKKTIKGKPPFEPLIGQSPPMKRIYELIDKVADTDSTILIEGESGTGKEVVAKTIHFKSLRGDKPFIPINCGAIPEALLESELFGHEKGAFTGATSFRIGRFELAHGGTLFLDEIGEMPFPLQVKLLRVLQEREFERVGGTRSIHVDVRVIAASNQNMEEAVTEKRFRKDLFYRLNVIPVALPPLRERKEDIPLLIAHFIQKFNEKRQAKLEGLSPDAEKILMNYSWPGNIRELENLMERLITFQQDGLIGASDLPDKLRRPQENPLPLQFEFPDGGVQFSELVLEFENRLIQHAMLKANDVKKTAARLLNLKRTTLVQKLKRRENLTLQ